MSDSTDPVRIVSPRRNIVILGVVCLVFAVMGAVAIALAPGKELNLILGIAAVGFFGVGGGVAFVTQWRRSVLLSADDDGVRISGVGLLPWSDIDRFGSTAAQLGVKLRRYDTYLATTRGETAASLRAARKQNGGWDVVWPSRLLDRSAGDAARDLERRRPT